MKTLKHWLLALIAGVTLLSSIGGGVQTVLAAGSSSSSSSASSSSASSTKATKSRLPAIKKRGYIIVGLSADYAPLEFHATVNGTDQIVGADVSLAKQIAKDMGVQLQIKEMGFDGLIGAMKTGKVDMVISGMSDTAERRKQVNFSESYTGEKNVMVIRKADAKKYKNISDFAGAKVGVQTQSLQETLARQQLPGAKIVQLEKANGVISQVETGKVDAGVMADTIANSYVARISSLQTVDPHFAAPITKTAVAIPKGDTALTNQINKTVRKVKKHNWYNKKYLPAAYKLQDQKASFWQKYGGYFFKGARNTLLFALITVIGGTIIGSLLAFMRRGKNIVLKAIAVAYIEFIRGTPLMVQAFMVFFGTQVLGLNLSAFFAGAIAMVINSGAYVAEIIRSGLSSIPVGQSEAARSLGLSNSLTMRYVVFPQALRNIWPALGNEFITDIKESSVLSVIGATDLMFEGQNVQGASFEPFLPIVIVAIFYFVMTFVLSRLLSLVEKRMNVSTKKA